MVKEKHYDAILEKIVAIFKELHLIVEEINGNFEEEQRQDPRLSRKIVESRIELTKSCVERFSSYRKRSQSSWSIEKDIGYVRQSIQSFYREFDNPFLGSHTWYQRISQLIQFLSDESRELQRIEDMNDC